jgi:hypothetical protein
MAAFLGISLCLLAGARAGGVWVGLRQLHSGAPRLGQSDRNRLLGRSRAMFSLAHMMNLFANKFARLDGRRFTFSLVFARPSSVSCSGICLTPSSEDLANNWGNSCAILAIQYLNSDQGGSRLINFKDRSSVNSARQEILLSFKLQRGRREMARDSFEVVDELPHLRVSRFQMSQPRHSCAT